MCAHRRCNNGGGYIHNAQAKGECITYPIRLMHNIPETVITACEFCTLKALGHNIRAIFKAPLSGEVDGGPSLGTSGVIMWTKPKPENVVTVLLSLVRFLGVFTNEGPTTTYNTKLLNSKIIILMYMYSFIIDIDECLVPDVCDINAQCDNTHGNFTCTCNTGYTGNGVSCCK